MAASRQFETVVLATVRATRRVARRREPLDRAGQYGQLIAVLQQQVAAVTAERDVALMEVLGQSGALSNRELAALLGLSAQRVGQLAQIARRGGRPRSKWATSVSPRAVTGRPQ